MEEKKQIIKILIVENNRTLVEYLKLGLKKASDICISGVVSNGEDALEFMKNNSVDMVLLDIIMPKMDGIEVLRNIMQNKVMHPKVIIVSSVNELSLIKNAVDIGADYYLLKPFELNLLIERIRYLSSNKYQAILEHDHISKPLREEKNLDSSKSDTEFEITEILKELKIPPQNMGYRYIRAAIIQCLTEEMDMSSLSKGLYPILGEKFNVSSKKIERAIRNSIDDIWTKGHIKESEVFKETIFTEGIKKPSNAQFISLLTEYYRNHQSQM